MTGEIFGFPNTIDPKRGTCHKDPTIFPLCHGQEYDWFSAWLQIAHTVPRPETLNEIVYRVIKGHNDIIQGIESMK
jgi:hypothetical protein